MEKLSMYSETFSRKVNTHHSPEIARYLDTLGHVIIWPGKRATRQLLFTYIASFFENESTYSEKEVNALLSELVSAVDCATLRRDLCDFRYLRRTRDGSQYWRIEQHKS
jgi:hypothetical protein